MAKKPSTTTDQLRALMQNHVEVTAASSPANAPLTPVAAMTLEQPAVRPLARMKSDQPPVGKWPGSMRYSLRLLPTEIAKINGIVNVSLQKTGERITLTDVLRVGLKRLGDSAPISGAELVALRTTDGRRH